MHIIADPHQRGQGPHKKRLQGLPRQKRHPRDSAHRAATQRPHAPPRNPPRGSGRPLEASGNLVAGVSGNATDAGTNHKETAETCRKNLCENPPLCFCDLRIKDTVDFKTNCRRRRQTRRRSARPRSGGQPRTESSHRRPGNARPPTSLIFSMETRPRAPGPATGSKRVLPKAYSTGATA
jgi:hypothetical protein